MIRPATQRKENPFDVIKLASQSTPDFHDLNTGPLEEYPVFVVGQLESNGAHNPLLDGCNFYGVGTTWSENFILKEGPYANSRYTPEPMIFELESGERGQKTLKEYESARSMTWELSGNIKGEVYSVPLRVLTSLDRWENNGVDAHREWRYITLEDPKGEINSLRAYVYISDWGRYEEFYKSNGGLQSCPFRSMKAMGSTKIFRTYHYRQSEPSAEEDYYHGFYYGDM